MKDNLKAKLPLLPDKPGVYIFKNEKKEIIYVGKAHSLRERVKSYFLPTASPKVGAIAADAADIDFVLTGSEREAAFLENNFVQRYQPKYNLRLKDDKSFPYLKLTVSEPYPGVYLTRKVEPGEARYFGPFSPASQARKTIHLLNKYFGLRGCEERIPGKQQRPCLEYDLKLCSAPCVGLITTSAYRENVENALLFLEGKTDKLIKNLKTQMARSAERLDYEQAAHLRDLVQAIEQIRDKPKLISVALEDSDIFGLARWDKRVSLFAFIMRQGKVRETAEEIYREEKETADAEALNRAIRAFYEKQRDIPEKLILPFEPESLSELAKELSRRKGAAVRIAVPQKGRRRKLVDLARRNAEFLMKRESPENLALEELARILGMAAPPQRIEGYDISNTGGDESVGSLVVFENGRPKKDEYRKYTIKSVTGPNDVASLKEVIRRRFTRILEEKSELPDLVLVDGGKGQLKAAESALKALGLEKLSVASLAKKEEVIFTREKKDGLRLDRTSPSLKLIQFIRDEAHRFAVSFHRQRREKKSFSSELNGLAGLGEKRKKMLLARYRSVNGIKRAPLEELASLIGSRAARKIKEAANDQRNRD
ncbi:MAG: excinuclease ABC subunit UvrC [Clostridiales bacterium]|nr:excinuclease ABC subunit UvrC [Clostridiales bacterium]